MDANCTYCGDHFATYMNIKSLHCTPETNVMSIIPQIKKKNKTF